MKAVVLDFGGPVLVTPFERLRALEQSLGLAPGTFDWRGPFDPAADPLWRAMQAGELGERAYWASRAAEVAEVTGEDGVPTMMARLFDGPEDELVRPQARALVAEARAAGLETAVLTNDLYDFHDQAWIDRMRVLAEVGCVVDTSRHGTRKPEPAAYRLVLDRLGGSPPTRRCSPTTSRPTPPGPRRPASRPFGSTSPGPTTATTRSARP